MKRRFAIGAVTLASVLAGCPAVLNGGLNGGTKTTTSTPTPTPTPSPSPSSTGNVTANLGNFPVVQVSGNVTANTTWDAQHIYEVTGVVDVNSGATLTVSPGATVSFDASTELDVGYGGSNSAGKLVAQGSATQPILFTSSQANPTNGAWNGIEFDSGSGHQMQFCTVQWAASNEAAVRVNNGSSLTLTDSKISDSASDGLKVDSTSTLASFARNTFAANKGYAVVLANPDAAAMIDTASSYTGNQNNAIEVQGGNINSTQTWAAPGVPYAISSNLYVNNGATLTLSPGATLSFDPIVQLDVGYGGSNPAGTLVAQGTAAAPIAFTADSASPTAGYWAGIEFDGGANHKMQNCTVSYAGNGNQAAVRVLTGSALSLTDSTISDSKAAGLQVDGNSSLASFAANTFSDNGTFPITVGNPATLASLDSASSFSGDTSEEVDVSGAPAVTGAESWANPGIPLYFEAGLLIGSSNQSGNLTLAPGLSLKFAQAQDLEVQLGSLTAGTTTGNPVTLTSNDGAEDWAGVQVDAGQTATLDNVTITDASGTDLSILDNAGTGGSTVTVSGLTVSNCKNSGIVVDTSAKLNGQTGNQLGNLSTLTGVTFTNVGSPALQGV